MTRYDRFRIKLEAWRDTPELWLVVACIAALLVMAWMARR